MRLGRSIDADGHILEPPDLWQKNLETKFKDRALGIARDAEGVESFIVDGHFSVLSRGLGIAAAFGQPGEVAFSNDFSYRDGPPGAYDPHARIKLLDEEEIDAVVLYPTMGLLRWGSDKFFWSSDFPHFDGFPGALRQLKKSIASMAPADQQNIIGDNAARAYNL